MSCFDWFETAVVTIVDLLLSCTGTVDTAWTEAETVFEGCWVMIDGTARRVGWLTDEVTVEVEVQPVSNSCKKVNVN